MVWGVVSWSILRVVLYFDEPIGQVKTQTTSKNTPRYYMPKHLMRYIYHEEIDESNLGSKFLQDRFLNDVMWIEVLQSQLTTKRISKNIWVNLVEAQ